jgi:predicted nucleic acid-binding protein
MRTLFIDTNIVLRLLNPAAPEHPSVRQTLALLEAQGARLVIGLQVLVETWVVATRPMDQNGLGLPATTARQLLDLCSQRFALVLENNTTLSYWLNLVTMTPVLGKRAHDARIAALMQSHGITELLTLNEQDFRGMPGIVTLHPAAVK